MAPRRRVTMKQVAEEAGVSVQTVSRVINQHPDVASETRQRILDIVERLGYQPSNVARSLIQGRSYTLGIVGYGLQYYGPSRVLSGIERQSTELGYSLLLSLLRNPEEDGVQMLRDMMRHHVDGVIWAVTEVGNNRDWTEDEVHRLGVPAIFLHTDQRPHLPIVDIDNCAGGRMATAHLIEQGSRSIGLVTGPRSWWAARQRELGWRDGMEKAGLSPRPDLVAEGDWSPASGERGLAELLERHPDLEGVFACNDQMALGVLKMAQKRGLRIPEDLAVVGFDNIPEAAYFWPPLTTVHQDLDALGRRAVQELVRLIEGEQERVVWLQPSLIVRSSSARQGGATQNASASHQAGRDAT